MVVEGYWYGFEKGQEGPMLIQKRTKRERTSKTHSLLERVLRLKNDQKLGS
jgi:hypothetical protein